ncbi:ribonuclease P protein component [Roseibium suaedae]|uniref:Ribonuclease P protein component n=1 Tax=Roseibium suaedae TaxID=735517 RepID=A0A1M7A6I1_9HYPH|nr:ribonuclease P protein component [Roseibium suaedae]SHL38288.1 ribonuclease P protein component [Roseibium suaedae]
MTVKDTQQTPPHMNTLKKRSEFLAVAKGGRVGRCAFVLQGLKRDGSEPPRIGYTVTKKTGNSAVRSRIKRRLRAAVAALAPEDIPIQADFVLVAREAALTAPFENLISDLKSGLPLSLDPKSAQRHRSPRKPKAKAQPGGASAPGRKQG